MASASNSSGKTVDTNKPSETCNLDAFIKNGFKTFVEATKNANELPKGRDLDFYCTHESFTDALGAQSDRLLNLINRVLQANAIDGNIKSSVLSSKEELIGEANDVILDRAVAAIDELNGLRSLPAEPVIQTVSAEISVNGSWNRVNKLTVNAGKDTPEQFNRKSISLLTAKNIVRPQSYFKDKVENGNTNPWRPGIVEKPNSLKPLALYVEPSENGGFEEYSHPYEFELEHFVPKPMFLADVDTPEAVKPVEETPLHEITTEEQVDDLLEELRQHTEIAVDLEHHSYRTFQGITCLMQISTRHADYLIDTLALRHKLHVLNEVFTKPSILKIFHGAESDIQWLQRDLSLYVVNMFDTHKAAKTLGYSGLGLAYLLDRFCSFMPNKKFQLADWRIRPLPEELKAYAREDTHYLIYVYEMLKKELYKQANGKDNLVRAVFQASTEVCKIRYCKPRWTPDSHLTLYRRRKKMFDNRQMYALKEIFKWRDAISRDEDESTGYVLPNHMMMQISEMLPREIQGILACCNPIPPLVRANSLELHQIILKAREQPLQKPIMQEGNRRMVSKELVKINIDSPLHCPHDLTKQDFKDNLPTLLNSKKNHEDGQQTLQLDCNQNVLPLEKIKSSCRLFNETNKQNGNKAVTNLTFLGPFERYKMIKPYLQAEAEKEEEKAKNEADASVDDRIAALHEHFVQAKNAVDTDDIDPDVAPSVAPTSTTRPASPLILNSNQALINMPGSKKRKRDVTPERDETPPDSHPLGDKRRPLPLYNHRQPQVQEEAPVKLGKWARRKMRKEERKRLGIVKPQKKKYVPTPQDVNEALKRRMRDSSDPWCEPGSSTAPYDYSNVDFSQFGGGGKRVNHKQVESKHKRKGQNKRGGSSGNRSQTRSMTFNHGSSSRGSRGGGQGSGSRGGGRGSGSRGGGHSSSYSR